MEYCQKISCPKCKHTELKKAGRGTHGVQRYRCLNSDCTTMLEYRYKAYELGLKKKVFEMTFNASGIRDIKCVLKIAKSTIIRTIKKKSANLVCINPNFGGNHEAQARREVSFRPYCIEVEITTNKSLLWNSLV